MYLFEKDTDVPPLERYILVRGDWIEILRVRLHVWGATICRAPRRNARSDQIHRYIYEYAYIYIYIYVYSP